MRRVRPLFPVLLLHAVVAAQTVMGEAESFDQSGGWVLDPQFMERMGSPFLLARGMGEPVSDARTVVNLRKAGTYRVWARTRDWAAPWSAKGAPGRFQLLVDGQPLAVAFGTKGAAWHWQDGGSISTAGRSVSLALDDLAGLDGRCDAVLLSVDPAFRPPDRGPALAKLRKRLLNIPATKQSAGNFDLIVSGGGMAGDFPAEDPCVWYEYAAQRYSAIVKDMQGHFTKAGKSLALRESPEGFAWRLSAKPLVSTTEIRWADGRTQSLDSLERPQLLFGPDGRPIALLVAADEEPARSHSFNVQIPLRSQ